jgi:hypothetical protein
MEQAIRTRQHTCKIKPHDSPQENILVRGSTHTAENKRDVTDWGHKAAMVTEDRARFGNQIEEAGGGMACVWQIRLGLVVLCRHQGKEGDLERRRQRC